VYSEAARAAADAADARARAGITLGPLDGAIVSIKDLFDVAGEPTRAGSKVLAAATPAAADAPVVRRLRAAGSIIVAKTNMTEFAFSILGINPHYGTPGNPADRARVPGGSSSGGAVAVADGMCEIAIGSDTGGSVRAPAAFCGIVGFKPSKFRILTEGAFPLSYTLDSIGPMARTVADCAVADTVLAGEENWRLEAESLGGLRLGIPQGRPLADLDRVVGARFPMRSNDWGRPACGSPMNSILSSTRWRKSAPRQRLPISRPTPSIANFWRRTLLTTIHSCAAASKADAIFRPPTMLRLCGRGRCSCARWTRGFPISTV
jgi:aspartyl-tRNA(Asn)/glutamyl-tRNA(Gln) amidotransferase subunit A